MMPACTGLPPGELISSTTACEPSSSKALRMAATTNSALASAPEAISPLMSTTAVCGVLLLAPVEAWRMAPKTSAATSSSQAKRKKIFQRRAERCSLKAAKASFSSVARSQPGSCAAARAADGVADCDHRSCDGGKFLSEPGVPGCWGSVISGLLRHRATHGGHGCGKTGRARSVHPGGCRTWKSSAANRPQRSIFHRLFAP